MNYIELSNRKVGYVEDINNTQFINDLKRNNLTYKIISQDEYRMKFAKQVLTPEQIYENILGGKYMISGEKR